MRLLLIAVLLQVLPALGGGIAEPRHSRDLQFLDMPDHPFALAGVPFFPEDAQATCLSDWVTFVTCAKTNCPNGVDKCPSGIFYDNSPKTVIDGRSRRMLCVFPIFQVWMGFLTNFL